MKYIKKFNESTNEYYFEITETMYLRAYGVNITSDIINKINVDTEKYSIDIDNEFGSNRVDDTQFNGIDISSIKRVEVYIYMSEDEWFYVSIVVDDTYYKCDQVEGLLQLLKNRNITV